MKPPICKLCKKAHWTWDSHQEIDTAVPEYVKEMVVGAMRDKQYFREERNVPTEARVPTMSPPAEELSPQCVCGKPRDGRHSSCAACRKRAYRERSK